MTRINVGIPPEDLSDKHLIAEHREIKRIPNAINSGRFSLKGQPANFKLGIGHVKFFYDKLSYLYDRYIKLYIECRIRGFNVTYFGNTWDNIPNEYMNDWNPSGCDRLIIQNRILERTIVKQIK